MSWPHAVTLTGESARLELLSQDHCAALTDAVRDGELWRLWYTIIPAPERMAAEIERRLALRKQGSMLPFAVISLVTGEPVGMTTYMNIDAASRQVEIGSTWYRKSVQRSGLNTECKLLLLRHASRRSIASRSSSAPTFSTIRAAAPSSGLAPSSMGCCETICEWRTEACATPAPIRSSPANGPRSGPILSGRWKSRGTDAHQRTRLRREECP